MQVKAGVQYVKDKHGILELQLQLSQIQISMPKHQPASQTYMIVAYAPSQSHQQFPPAAIPHPPLPTLSNAPPPLPVRHTNPKWLLH